MSRAQGTAPRPRWLALVATLVLAFMLVPIGVVVLYSFNASRSFQRFDGFSLDWYRAFAADETLTSAMGVSLRVAVLTVVVAIPLGTSIAIGVERWRARIASPVALAILAPLATPEIAFGAAVLSTIVELGIPASLATLVIAHVTFLSGIVVIIVRSRLTSMSLDSEDAAMDLGCTRLGALFRVTLPALFPVLVATGAFVFALSFDTFVLSFFAGGESTQTLPVRIYAALRLGLTPTINAAGTVMLVVSLVVAVSGFLLWRLTSRRRTAG